MGGLNEAETHSTRDSGLGTDLARYAELLNVPLSAMAAGYLWQWWFRRMEQRERRFRSQAAQAQLGAEAGILDGLVAPGMSDPRRAAVIRRQREFGAEVLLVGHHAGDGSTAALGSRMLERLRDDIAGCVEATRITIRQHPPASPAACTLVAESPGARLFRRYFADGGLIG